MPARLTTRVDKPKPLNDNAQNGRISLPRERRSRLAQTQRRLSSKEGTVPTAVPTRLAQPGDRVRL